MELLTEAIRLSRQKRFGASSEHSSEDAMEQLSFLFNEAEVYSAQEDAVSVVVAAHKWHKKHEYTLDELPENVPVEVVEHRLPEEELACPKCGETMSEIGKDVRRRLKLEPAKVIVVEDWYYTYACRKCEKENIETPVVKVAREPNFIPGSFSTPDAVAHLMVQKFVMGSPLYRQEQELRRQGISLSRQTMSNWLLWSAEYLLAPVYNWLHRELLTREVLHADETTLQVLHEPGKTTQSKSYMWLYRTGGDTDRPIMLYEYQPDRGACHPQTFLSGFKGYLHTDGYSGYHSLPEEITVVGCWAHARRKFDEAMKSLPKGKAKNSSAAQGLAYCNLLFKIEEGLASLSPEERYVGMGKYQNRHSEIRAGQSIHLSQGTMVLSARLSQRRRLELSNNRAERSIKPFVIDRKNFLFANTPNGARSIAVVFSLSQSAIDNKLVPFRYPTWLMTAAADMDLNQPENV